ncbi:Sbal_3080 family lipoprotein [Janthinobacterium sp. 1_2014MBL_MicDiv]|uniref:Sbal_3080 family lipoprotein n=1 Tax=Janthinobacterium sp. 1_2014MBL_MicDiv TaxID=1644131 RepID=UPI0008F4D440|nr:Sbal_3080 family lipoprotein [Janthinobacterium sp. 1_2014MBL_MicDiv]APA66567.1 hypothetical protein YQ44_00620 [Janthinobacterium sp. 1_2014MBL_MicDiv]
MIKKIVLFAAVMFLFTGCAIHQTVKPVGNFATKEVCILNNPDVRVGFMVAYKRALEGKGYVARQLPVTASIIECPLTSTYTANWRWDLAMYMHYANIKVYNNGKVVGEAVYDAKRAGLNTGKFIDADQKIGELVNQLFPGGAGS